MRLCKLGLLKIVERALAVATLDLLVAQRIIWGGGGEGWYWTTRRLSCFVWKLERRAHSIEVSIALRNNRWRALKENVPSRTDEIERGEISRGTNWTIRMRCLADRIHQDILLRSDDPWHFARLRELETAYESVGGIPHVERRVDIPGH